LPSKQLFIIAGIKYPISTDRFPYSISLPYFPQQLFVFPELVVLTITHRMKK